MSRLVQFTLSPTEEQYSMLNRYAVFAHYTHNELVATVRAAKGKVPADPTDFKRWLYDQLRVILEKSHRQPWFIQVPSRLIDSIVHRIYSLQQTHTSRTSRKALGEEGVPASYNLMPNLEYGTYEPILSFALGSETMAGRYFCIMEIKTPNGSEVSYWLRLPEVAGGYKLGWLRIHGTSFNLPVPSVIHIRMGADAVLAELKIPNSRHTDLYLTCHFWSESRDL